jgi:hypothetical protein
MRDCIRLRLAKQYKVETLGDGQASGARPGFGGRAGEKSLTADPGHIRPREQKDVDGSKELEHAARRTQRDSTERMELTQR